jgi:hypothetical protein
MNVASQGAWPSKANWSFTGTVATCCSKTIGNSNYRKRVISPNLQTDDIPLATLSQLGHEHITQSQILYAKDGSRTFR